MEICEFYFLAMQSRLVWVAGGADTNYTVKYSFGRRDHVWTYVDEETRHTLTVNLLFAGGLYVEGQDGCGGSDPGIGLARARYPPTSDIVILDAGTWELSVRFEHIAMPFVACMHALHHSV